MAWPINRTEFGPNRSPVLTGVDYIDEQSIVPLAVDPTSGSLKVNATVTSSGGVAQTQVRNSSNTWTDVGYSSGNLNMPVNVENFPSTQPVSGTVTATQTTGSNLHVVVDSGSITTSTSTLPTTPLYGQTTIATTGTAVQLPNKTLTGGVIVQALAGNAADIYVGDSSVTTSNGFQLQPGQATSVAVGNVDDLYINGTAADGVCFIGT